MGVAPVARITASNAAARGSSATTVVTNALAALAPKRGEIRLHTPETASAEIDRLQGLGVSVTEIGRSVEGRPIRALTAGTGPIQLAAISGSHADEPVGTATTLRLIEQLHTNPKLADLASLITLNVVPMVNPDGSARNASWFGAWEKKPDVRTYLQSVVRDAAVNDIEWGYPTQPGEAVRPENAAVALWLKSLGPLDHFASLHSMFFGGGALLLVSGHDTPTAIARQQAFTAAAAKHRLPLHTYDRFGEKGHTFIGPGLQTMPTAEAMVDFFGAGAFRQSSMAFAKATNQVPFAAVTEIPMSYDTRVSSKKPVARTRVAEQQRLSTGLTALGTECQGWLNTLAMLPEASDPVFAQRLAQLQTRVNGHQKNAAALAEDVGRYGTAQATEGNVVANDFMLARRRAELTYQFSQLTPKLSSDPGQALGEALKAALAKSYQHLKSDFQLQFPSLEAHAAMQMAVVLSGVLGSPAS